MNKKKENISVEKRIEIVQRAINKLQDEGLIVYKATKEHINDFMENNMNYIVFEKDGNVTRYTSCKLACGKTWNQVKNIKIRHEPKELDHAYFNENNLKMSWFNFNCWKELGVVFLSRHDYNVIKFHKKKKEENEGGNI